jgi:hypothetical protein
MRNHRPSTKRLLSGSCGPCRILAQKVCTRSYEGAEIRTHGPPQAQEYRLRLKRPAPRALYEFPLSFPASFSLAAVSFSPEMNRSYLKNVRRFF